MIKGKFTWYDLALFVGMAVTIWRTVIQGHVIRRVRTELEKAKAKIEELRAKHPTEGPDHQPVPSPPDEVVAREP